MIETIKKLLQPVQRRVMNMLARGIIEATYDDKELQRLQVTLLADEVMDKVERLEEYGLSSRPLPGAEVLMASVGGDRSNGIVIRVADRRYRIKNMAAGEVALYTDEGDTIHFKRGRKIEITAGVKVKVTAPEVEVIASTKVKLTTPLVEASGNLSVTGSITSGGNMTSGGNLSVTGTSTLTGAVTAPGGVASVGIISGGTLATPSISDVGSKIDEIRTKFNAHTHPENGITTGAPNPPTVT